QAFHAPLQCREALHFVATMPPPANECSVTKVLDQRSSSFNRPMPGKLVFCSRVLEGDFCHVAMQTPCRCSAKASVLQCKGHVFCQLLQCKSKNYNNYRIDCSL